MSLRTLLLRVIVWQPGLSRALAILALGSERPASCRALAGQLGWRRLSLLGKRPGSLRWGALLHQPPGQDCGVWGQHRTHLGSTQTFLLTRQLQVTSYLQNKGGSPRAGRENSTLSHQDRGLGLHGHPELNGPKGSRKAPAAGSDFSAGRAWSRPQQERVAGIETVRAEKKCKGHPPQPLQRPWPADPQASSFVGPQGVGSLYSFLPFRPHRTVHPQGDLCQKSGHLFKPREREDTNVLGKAEGETKPTACLSPDLTGEGFQGRALLIGPTGPFQPQTHKLLFLVEGNRISLFS